MEQCTKNKLFHIFALVISVSFVLIIVEIFARFMVYSMGSYLEEIDPKHYQMIRKNDPPFQFDKTYWQWDNFWGDRVEPNNKGIFRGYRWPKAEFRNEIEINSMGYRSSKEYDVGNSKMRIAVIGDSFVEGLEVREEKSFVKIMQEQLRKRELYTRVYNFGKRCTGTIHHYVSFFEDVLKIKPQVVILCFSMSDLIDDTDEYSKDNYHLSPRYEYDSGKIKVFGFGKNKQDPLGAYQLANEPPVKLWKQLILDSTNHISEKLQSSVFLKFLKVFAKSILDSKIEVDAKFDVYKKKFPKELSDTFKLTIDLIEKMDIYCKKNKIKFFVVHLPAKEQVRKELLVNYLEQRPYIARVKDYDEEKYSRQMANELEKRRIRFFDLLPQLKGRDDKQHLYYGFDAHFNNRGHKVLGDLISKFIIDNGIM